MGAREKHRESVQAQESLGLREKRQKRREDMGILPGSRRVLMGPAV